MSKEDKNCNMFEIVNSFRGKGKFNFVYSQTITIDLSFTIIQYSNAKIEIHCFPIDNSQQTLLQLMQLLNDFQNEEIIVNMLGMVNESTYGEIKVKEAYITTLKLDFKNGNLWIKLVLRSFLPVEIVFNKLKLDKDIKICAGLTNFVFGNCSSDDNSFSGFQADIEGYSINFNKIPDYAQCVKALEDNNNPKTILLTSEAVVNYTTGVSVNFDDIFKNLSELLSYASRTRISHIYENYYSGEELFKVILKPVLTSKYHKNNNLIDSHHHNQCTLKSYLESCYTPYSQFVNQFGLNIVISFYLESINSTYMDMGFLLNTTALETLLSGYVLLRDEESNPITQSIIKRNKKTIKKIFKDEGLDLDDVADKIAIEISYSNLSVPEKLNAFIKDRRFTLKLDKYDRDFTTIRNSIAHTGKFPKEIKSSGKLRQINSKTECDRLIYLTDRIILTILNYKGNLFHNILNGSQEIL